MPTTNQALTTKLPVRTGGAMRKTFVSGKQFAEWLKESDFRLVAEYARKTGVEVFLLLKEDK